MGFRAFPSSLLSGRFTGSRGLQMDSIKIWRAARRLYRADQIMARAQASANPARAILQVAASQTDGGLLTAGMYRIAVDAAGFVEVTLLPMLRGDQLELPLSG